MPDEERESSRENRQDDGVANVLGLLPLAIGAGLLPQDEVRLFTLSRGSYNAEVGERNRRRVLYVVREFHATEGYSPTVRQIAENTGLAPSAVHRHLEVLVEDDLVVKTPRGYAPCL